MCLPSFVCKGMNNRCRDLTVRKSTWRLIFVRRNLSSSSSTFRHSVVATETPSLASAHIANMCTKIATTLENNGWRSQV
jgi:hypothetical protein